MFKMQLLVVSCAERLMYTSLGAEGLKTVSKTTTVPELKAASLMGTYGGDDLELHAFLNSKLYGCEWSASRGGRFVSRNSAFLCPPDRRPYQPPELILTPQ